MSVCECLRVLGGLSGAGFAGFIEIFRMGEDLLTQVRSDESLRAFTRDHERLRVFTCVGRVVWSRICRIFWDFQDGGGPADAGGARTSVGREFASVCECLRVLGGLGGAGFAGFIGIFRIGEDLLTQVRSYERWMRVCERLRVFTRDWYGLFLWVDHEMGRISCIQTDAGCFVQSMRGSSVGVRWSGL